MLFSGAINGVDSTWPLAFWYACAFTCSANKLTYDSVCSQQHRGNVVFQDTIGKSHRELPSAIGHTHKLHLEVPLGDIIVIEQIKHKHNSNRFVGAKDNK